MPRTRYDEVPSELRPEFHAAHTTMKLVEARAALRRLVEAMRHVHGAFGVADWTIGSPDQAHVLETALRATKDEIDHVLRLLHEDRPEAAPAARQQP